MLARSDRRNQEQGSYKGRVGRKAKGEKNALK